MTAIPMLPNVLLYHIKSTWIIYEIQELNVCNSIPPISGLQTLTYLQSLMIADHMLVIYLFNLILATTTIELMIIELLS